MKTSRAQKRQLHKKTNIAMRLAAVLLIMVCVSTWMLSGLLAKYTVQSDGSDGARVISFGQLTLTETGDFVGNNEMMIIPGVDLTKKAVIDFGGSEAATYVFVEVLPTSVWLITNDNKSYSVKVNDKTAMQWSIEDGWTFLKPDVGINSDVTYVYYRELAPNTVLNEVDIIAEGGKITVSDQITKSVISAMTNISIKLRATVVQAGGFESPEAAWNSVAEKEG